MRSAGLPIQTIQQDITQLAVDVIVNAANRSLLGGGGVDGAIHRAAGPELLTFCRNLNGCETGQAKISPGFQLPAKHIIHTVGPVWQGGQNNEADLLASCYQQSLELAEQHQLLSIAFPAISCGIYGYPTEQAVPIAVKTVKNFLAATSSPMQVIFVCFDATLHRMYEQQIENGP